MLIKNKSAVITGCNKGIGKEILELFSQNRANIFACVRRIDQNFIKLTKTVEEKYQNKIVPIELDFSNEELVKEAANKILASKEKIDILINNAGMIYTGLFQMTSKKKFEEIFNVNFFSQSLFTQYIVKSMVKNKEGSITFISSTSAIDGNIGRSAYLASKASINSLTKVLSRELGSYNIRVNAIAPGLTSTDMMRENTPEKFVKETINSTSLKRIGNPKEIANVALFLSSSMSNYVTGQVIRVDGGM
tara:strand:- start:224 stop:967 length:744 start_codon:yes stop_codon:yes gene_type:complete